MNSYLKLAKKLEERIRGAMHAINTQPSQALKPEVKQGVKIVKVSSLYSAGDEFDIQYDTRGNISVFATNVADYYREFTKNQNAKTGEVMIDRTDDFVYVPIERRSLQTDIKVGRLEVQRSHSDSIQVRKGIFCGSKDFLRFYDYLKGQTGH